jgi:hypothetical protein
MKIRPVGAKLFHADGQMEGDTHSEANGRFSQFCEHIYKGFFFTIIENQSSYNILYLVR